jgi:cell division protein FtsQ|tara:strand:- start:510 stop:1238 length:729 start_codon:yes stop_codon:yes gene_type:complete
MARERKNYVKKQKKPLKYFLNKIFKIIFYLLLIFSVAFFIYIIENSTLLKPNISWKIDGELRSQPYEYDDLINPLLNNKYLLNLSKIKSKLEEHPWTAKVEIERILWNKIRISLKRHDIAMRHGSEGYISSQGVLFNPNLTIKSDSPIGIVSGREVKQFYFDYTMYQSILDPVKISYFERTSIDELTLDNNIKVILGYQKQNERLELFVKSFEKLKKYKKIKTRGIFDMRYPNGFALSYSPL